MTAFSRWASVFVVLTIGASIYFYQSAELARSDLARVSGQLNGANAVISNASLAMKIFSAIAAERANEKERDRQQGEKRRIALRDDLQGDRCAFEPVPAAAERRLFERADGVRSGAVPAAARRSASANASAIPTPER